MVLERARQGSTDGRARNDVAEELRCRSLRRHRLGWRAPLLRFLSRRAKDKKRGRDGTKYSKFHSSNYLTHHLASISLAAVYTDAVHVEEGVDGLKQSALALAPCASE